MKQFYYIDRNNQPIGPISYYELTSCPITPNTLVWCEGMSNWEEARQVQEVSNLFHFNGPSLHPPLPSQNNNGPSAIIVCPHCGTSYNVDKSNLDQAYLNYDCDKCRNQFQVEFFDYCPNCRINIGFESTGMENVGKTEQYTQFGLNVLKGFFDPINSIDTAFSAKDSNGVGKCPTCNSWFIRCCKCNEMTEMPIGTKISDYITCRHCGQKLSPGAAENSHKHSKKYYNN